MLAARAILAAGPAPATLDAVVAAFDTVCVKPGPIVSAQRDAAKIADPSLIDPRTPDVKPATSAADHGPIHYLLFANGKASTCGVFASVIPDATVADMARLLTARYGVEMGKSRGSKMVERGFFKLGDRTIAYEVAEQPAGRGALLNVEDRHR